MTNIKDYKITSCLCCNSEVLLSTLNLGNQPPANSYLTNNEDSPKDFPLELMLCINCWHSQLSFCVDRTSIFNNYTYVSGTSSTLINYFSWFANSLYTSLGENSTVLEIAANDGSLIKEMLKCGLKCTGVDPAKNIVDIAQANGLPVEYGYWPEYSKNIKDSFDAIVAMNVLAHVDNPLNFLIACASKLSFDGIILVQPSQARMFENGEFDTIYHEHISFFNSKSISSLANRAGLKLVDSFLVKIHGDSPVFILKHLNSIGNKYNLSSFRQGDYSITENLNTYEEKIKLFKELTYLAFKTKANNRMNEVISIVNQHKIKNYKIVFVGAAAKAITFINSTKIQPDHLLDESPYKIGLFAPGSLCKVESLNSISHYSLNEPCLFIISAWNFKTELIKKIKSKYKKNSSYLTYYPKLELFK
jgi:SAM-dependent methyltransferase